LLQAPLLQATIAALSGNFAAKETKWRLNETNDLASRQRGVGGNLRALCND
jgi:hypothetical protein